eukprot:CAMPEP_0118651016 /NCGR_PEP_ID=MMETSP0785-20121206/10558_1 /TAXON_ID=91992 /ORGANISM="Bolidomonas pacifica, Strain CCMP 1866" /LENGTH=191 /DNA_ID=CAMNT_0006543435 /DNA_START=170 /DNA_END=742 /DNA_ORIENTATION=+
MVFTGQSSTGRTLIMGENQRENELLIRNSLPTDVWFHVSNLSSAHVYVRSCIDLTLTPSEDWGIDQATINEACKLVKHNSIKGCKLQEATVVATRWNNLKKVEGTEDGVVGYHEESQCKYYASVKKDNGVGRRFDKSKGTADIAEWEVERKRYYKEQKNLEKKQRRDEEARKKEEERERKEREEEYSYDRV